MGAAMSVITAAAVVANSNKYHEEEKAKKPTPIKKHQFKGDHVSRSDITGILQQYLKHFGGTDKKLNRFGFIELVDNVQIKVDFEEQIKNLCEYIYHHFKEEKLMSLRIDKNGKSHIIGNGK